MIVLLFITYTALPVENIVRPSYSPLNQPYPECFKPIGNIFDYLE